MKANIEGLGEGVVAADMPDTQWTDVRQEHAQVRRTRVSAWLCSCVDCGHPMFPKVSVHGHRFFAHRPGALDSCPLRATDGESEGHRRRKLAIYRAVTKVRGWTAEIEARAPGLDPITMRPVIVDVVARRTTGASVAANRTPLQGWEVQLSKVDDGHVLNRQQFRERWLDRCTWVTDYRPSWAQRLPWYQLAGTESRGDLVVDGVFRWDTVRAEDVREDPFPADAMVKYVLRGALWAQDEGWRLEYLRPSSANRPRRAALSRQNVKGVVADYCTRQDVLPAEARGWTDVDWRRYSRIALDRRNHGERLSILDREAIARCPTTDLGDDLDELIAAEGIPAYDHLRDTKPCILCGQITVVSISVDFPLHHHCAWHVARGDTCRFADV